MLLQAITETIRLPCLRVRVDNFRVALPHFAHLHPLVALFLARPPQARSLAQRALSRICTERINVKRRQLVNSPTLVPCLPLMLQLARLFQTQALQALSFALLANTPVHPARCNALTFPLDFILQMKERRHAALLLSPWAHSPRRL